MGSLSGKASAFSKNTLKGVELAIQQAQDEGLKIELVKINNSGNPKTAVSNMNKLVQQNDVMAILGEVSSAMSLAIAPIAQQAQIPMVSPTSTHPRVTEIGNYIFRICFIDPFQGFVMAKFAIEHLKMTKVAILKDSASEYSKGLSDHFTNTFESLGGEILMDEVYHSGDRDFKVQLEQIRKTSPEGLFLPGYYRDVALIARQARTMGIRAQFLGGDGWDSSRLFEIGRESVNGGFFTNHFTLESKEPKAQEFIKQFRKKYSKNPDGLSARGYDAAQVIIEAMKQAKKISRQSIRNELAALKDFPGVTGTTTMNIKRNAIKPAVVLKVEGPTHKYITTIKP